MTHIARVFTSLSGYSIRYETFEGKKYIVAPVVALVEGVHTGMDGVPTYYPAYEIAQYPAAWDGVPVVINHPTASDGGPASANVPATLETSSVGQLFNTQFDPNGAKLKSEIWIQEEKANTLAPEVLELLLNGGQLEVSTAMFGNEAGPSGQWNGEAYDVIWTDYRPDHLALLPNGVGACSNADGCGVRYNETGGRMVDNIRSAARSPSYDGTESTSWGNVKKTFMAYRDAYYSAEGDKPDDVPSTVADAPAVMKSWIAARTLLGDAKADNERDLMFFPVVNPKTGKLNEGALKAVISGRGEAADIPDAVKASAQNKARALLEEHFDYEPPKSQANTTFSRTVDWLAKRLGFKAGELSHDDIRESLRNKLQEVISGKPDVWVRDVYDGSLIYELTEDTGGVLIGPSRLYRRAYAIDADGVVTLGESPVEVKEETKYVPVETPATNLGSGKTPEGKEETEVDKKELVDGLIACEHTRFAEEDREFLSALEDGQLEKLGVTDESLARLEEKPPSEDPPKEDPPKEEPPKTDPEKENAESTTKDFDTGHPVSMEKYLDTVPEELKPTMTMAVNAYQRRHAELVKSLMANERNTFREDRLKEMEVPELEAMARLANDEVSDVIPDYSGRVGAPASGLAANEAPEPQEVWPAKK